MVLCSFLAYLVAYFSLFKGIKSATKLVFITVPLPYILLTILFIKGLTLEGAGTGLKYLLKPDFSKIGADAFKEAIVQSIFGSGAVFGPIMYFSSVRDPNQKMIKSSIVLPITAACTSIFASLAIFTFLGHVSHKLNIPIDKIPSNSEDLAFIAYPGVINLLRGSNFWSVVFFVMLFSVGIDSAITGYEYCMVWLSHAIPPLGRLRREISTAIVFGSLFLLSLIFARP